MKQWIVKDSAGNIHGPFDEEIICQKILNLEFSGKEHISIYQSSPQVWKAFSSHEFFKKALQKAYQKTASFEEVSLKSHSSSLKNKSKNSSTHSEELDLSQSNTCRVSQNDQGRFKHVRVKGKDSVIELEDSKSVWLSYIFKSFVIPIGLLGGFFYLLLLYFDDSSQEDSNPLDLDRVQLLVPRDNQLSKSSSETEDKINKGLIFYFQNQASDYMKAQEEFVQALEGSPRHKLAYVYLCLTYFELWPFTNQRSDDLKALSTVLQKSESVDQNGIHSSICRSVYLIVQEQYISAENLIQNSIDLLNQGLEIENLSPFLYYLRGAIRFHQLKLDLALQDLENAQTLLPKMYNVLFLKAQIFEQKNQFNLALKIYSDISQSQANHKTSLLAQGILRYNYLKQFDQGEKIIRDALKRPGLISPQYLSSAYFILAQVALKINDSEEFLEYGKKAYALNPANAELAQLLKNSGLSESQQKKLKKTKVKSRLLIEQGDQFEREGDVFKAQSYYEQAFNVDQNKNAIAALKMAKSLWESGFSLQAIDWLQKAIYADSQYIRPYILLSEYYSHVYKMKEAAQILQTANRKSSNNIEVFKGYANLALKEKAFSIAVQFAQKALEIYELDVESHLILSQALYFLGKFNDSFAVISKARELAFNNRDTHIQYGKALGKIKGTDSAFNYFEDLIFKTQKGSQNHTQYVLALSEFLFDHREFKNSIQVLEILSDLEKKPIQYHILLGKIYAEEERTIQQAYEEFLKAAVINPSDPQVMYQLSLILIKFRKYDEAESYLEKILSSYSSYPQINYSIARILSLKGGDKNLRSALKKLEEEIKLNPDFVEVYRLEGDVYEKLGEYTLCARSYQKAIENFPQDSDSYIKSASCYRQSGDIDLALQILKGATGAKEKSSNPYIYRELGSLYEMKQDYTQATKNYALYINILPHADDRKSIEEKVKNFDQ